MLRESTVTASAKERQAASRLVSEVGRALHACGSAADRVEAAMQEVAKALGLEAEFLTTPTSIIASYRHGGAERVALRRVTPREVSLDKLARVESLVRSAIAGDLNLSVCRDRLAAIVDGPRLYGPLALTGGFALAAAAAARFFGGGEGELLASLAAGALTGLLAQALAGRRGGEVFPLAASLLAVLTAGLSARVLGVAPQVVTLSGLIVLVPGLTATLAVNELATGHLVSGSARLVSAGMTLLQIAFGVSLGARLFTGWTGLATIAPAAPLPGWTLVPAVLVCGPALTVLFEARQDRLPTILTSCVTAYLAARLASNAFGPEVGVLIAAFLLATVANLYGRHRRRPAAEMLLPGLLLLVPGSLGFEAVSSMLRGEALSGVEAAFSMAMMALAIVTALLVANALVPAGAVRAGIDRPR